MLAYWFFFSPLKTEKIVSHRTKKPRGKQVSLASSLSVFVCTAKKGTGHVFLVVLALFLLKRRNSLTAFLPCVTVTTP